MKVSELKKSLYEKIEQVNDGNLLNALHVIISKRRASMHYFAKTAGTHKGG